MTDSKSGKEGTEVEAAAVDADEVEASATESGVVDTDDSPAAVAETKVEEDLAAAEQDTASEPQPESAGPAEDASEDEVDTEEFMPGVSNNQVVMITGFGLLVLVLIVMLASPNGSEVPVATGDGDEMTGAEVAASSAGTAVTPPASASVPPPSAPAPSMPASPARPAVGDIVGDGIIERKGEGRHFYTSIAIPPGAETMYLSGTGARALPDASWGSMEQQVVDTFTRFKATLEAEGWSMSDIVQVRAFAVADEFGYLDFDGFNRGYRQFFGTADNPMKPVRSFVEIAGLVVPGWLVEIEIRAARMPE